MTARLLLLDNYDSFTHNLRQALGGLGARVTVARNDAPDLALGGDWTHLVVSPGPGRPEAAGRSLEAIRACAGRLPVLGVCLGHQALALAFGARVARATRPVHGQRDAVHHDGKGLFSSLPNPFPAARYHSLAVAREGLPGVLEVSAWAPDGTVMGIRHRDLPACGVQFHPESFMTPDGVRLLRNFLAGGY